MNYYYEQLLISVKKHFTVDFRWDSNEGRNRCVFIFFIFCIKMYIAAVNRGCGTPMWVCA